MSGSTPTLIPSDRIDPEVKNGLDALLTATGPGGFRHYTLAQRRQMYADSNAAALAAQPIDSRITHSDELIPGYRGEPIRIRTYRPSVETEKLLPAILYIHGGGLNHGSIDTDERQAAPLVRDVIGGAIVISVDYRLAPEHPHPTPVEDCYAALTWLWDNVSALGADRERIVVYGGSAGGGLAAGVTLLARDRQGPAIAYQVLLYPMLDDRNETPSSREITDVGIWDRDLNLEAWRYLLHGTKETPSNRPGTAVDADVSAYAAPARAADLTQLPPTYLDVGELDLFRDEDIAYANRLMTAGVPVELHVYPGGIHASELLAPNAALSQRITAYRRDALNRALAPR
ncbi:alpha/beta hydrolase [Rhodococcus tibetensis]|uniref:Alpha/beta hydrolase n=1 Tax=Rhodococcus tibetensis TaxID=2965064 RepID=A0ABT1QGI7_9NOCA|nr:alpha/beta hydrolase [Rhodococcus sp. FXJ9.536]MCQ4121361.1 alpha/beta hydrolase [Rhodococcus sp. FXJ9.536]